MMVASCLIAMPFGWAMAQDPPLPSGLESEPEAQRQRQSGDAGAPSLPAGLDGGGSEPVLPDGLGDGSDAVPGDEGNEGGHEERLGGITGFWDLRVGSRLQTDAAQSEDFILGESRLQLSRTWYTEAATTTVTGDFLYDPIAEDQEVDLETGAGWFDLREANVLLRPLEFVDIRIGRQILTWGVGDLVFLNDLFAKDFVSFLNGRDVEYLKAPSDALRVSLFGETANLDLVYTPGFDADRFVTGERLSWSNPLEGRITGEDAVVSPDVPDDWFRDDEIAVRLYGNAGAYELAAYAYRGYWKSPRGIQPSGAPFFPELSVYGSSLRGPAIGGIASAEIAYYDSREDRAGTDPRIPNSEWRALIGYERELFPELTVSAQYYAEAVSDFGALKDALPPNRDAGDRIRHTLTLRLTQLAMNQRLTLSAFNFWSPDGGDGHLRLRASYEITDVWSAEAGANLFYGADDSTFFGQFEDNSNMFLAVRRGF